MGTWRQEILGRRRDGAARDHNGNQQGKSGVSSHGSDPFFW
jgi:hypothetical protein